jgi:hypothetical protein
MGGVLKKEGGVYKRNVMYQRVLARYQVQLGNACREALLQQDAEIVKQSLKNTRYQVELGNEPQYH